MGGRRGWVLGGLFERPRRKVRSLTTFFFFSFSRVIFSNRVPISQ